MYSCFRGLGVSKQENVEKTCRFCCKNMEFYVLIQRKKGSQLGDMVKQLFTMKYVAIALMTVTALASFVDPAIASNTQQIQQAAVQNAQNANLAAQSGTLSDILTNFGNNIEDVTPFVVGICYIMASMFIGISLFKARDLMDSGGQKATPVDVVKYMGAGGLLLAMPAIVTMIVSTLGTEGDTHVQENTGWDSPAAGGSGGLDTLVVNFMKDLHGPSLTLITGFCFTIGFIIIANGLYRLTTSAQQGARGPTGLGTLMTFVIGGLLVSFSSSMANISETLFGSNEAMTTIQFMALEAQMSNPDYVKGVFSAILAFMGIVGYISVARGLYLFKLSGDGNQQATMMGAGAHVIAGAMLINFGQVANMIQNTLGLTTYGILFN